MLTFFFVLETRVYFPKGFGTLNPNPNIDRIASVTSGFQDILT